MTLTLFREIFWANGELAFLWFGLDVLFLLCLVPICHNQRHNPWQIWKLHCNSIELKKTHLNTFCSVEQSSHYSKCKNFFYAPASKAAFTAKNEAMKFAAISSICRIQAKGVAPILLDAKVN